LQLASIAGMKNNGSSAALFPARMSSNRSMGEGPGQTKLPEYDTNPVILRYSIDCLGSLALAQSMDC